LTVASPLPAPDLDHVVRHTRELWEDLRGQTMFLTGGTGFVGTWLLESLLWANDRLALDANVVVLTRHPERFRLTTPHLAEHPNVRILAGDVISFAFPEGTFPFVVHAATEAAFAPDAARPLGSFGRDVDGTRRVLEFACKHGTRRLLFTSSGAVYGKQPPAMTHVSEDYAGAPFTTDAGTAYGQAKRTSESMIAIQSRACGFDAMIARLFAFVGPRLPLDANYAVGNFIRDALAGGPVRIAGDGTPCRSYLYAADLAIWLWTILLRGQSAYPYNVGSPDELTIEALAHTVIRVLDPGIKIEIGGQPKGGEPRLRYVPDTTRATRELGVKPLITLEEGIRRTAQWYSAGSPVKSVWELQSGPHGAEPALHPVRPMKE
jgi:dTDP-glucose 4,6-dehydratase